MKYLCLVYCQEKKLAALSDSEMEALVRESRAYDEALRGSGHLIAAHALQPARETTTVRVRNGKSFATDGSNPDTKEQLGGFILIDAEGLHDALHVAAKIPLARLGSIEVRPIRALQPPGRELRRRLSNSVSAKRLSANHSRSTTIGSEP